MLAESLITESLSRYLSRELNVSQSTLTAESALIDAGLIDSLSIFRLIVFIEQEFGTSVVDEDITLENFETLKAIARLVQAKTNR